MNIVEMFYDNGKLNKNKLKEEWIKKNHNSLYNDITNFSKLLNFDVIKFTHLFWHFNNNLINYPICEYCGEYNKRFYGLEDGYKLGCSRSCAIQLTRHKSNETRKINTIKKYGVEHTTQLKSTKDKMKKTTFDRYGFEHATKNSYIMDKIKKTNLSRYGSELPLQNEEIKNKMVSNFIYKWGVDNPSKSSLIKEMKVERSLEKYGIDYHVNNEIIRDKINNTRDINLFNKMVVEYSNINFDILSYKNSQINIKCNKCQEIFDVSYSLLYLRYIRYNTDVCIKCNPLNSNKVSKGEYEIIDYLNEIGITNIVASDRNIISPYEIDIYLPDYNLGIEFNGVYWHSEIIKNKKYHYDKRLLSNEIELIQIWEDSWIFQKDKIKSLLRNKLSKTVNKIYARNCVIRIVNSKEVKEFLNNNHLQGWSVSKYNYGLYFDNELLSLITFSKGRANTNSLNKDYELVRFCNKLNYNVVGALSKLFKHFIKNEDPSKIISYCDMDLFNGNGYLNLGMKLESCNIGYSWCDGKIRHNRWNFRKDKLVKEGFDKNLSEYEIMMGRGWYRCWTSGNSKYIWLK